MQLYINVLCSPRGNILKSFRGCFLFFADVILFQCLALDRTICFIFLVAVTTLGFHNFSAGFVPKPSVHSVIVGELACCRDDLQSSL